jgi:putative MATE family efflux protein
MEVYMTALVRDRDFYKQLITISVPIALQNLIGFGLSMMDTVMLGSLGEQQISASSIANQPYFIFTVFLFGLASGASVLTAQYWGKGDTSAISRVLTMALKAAVGCSMLFGALVLVFPGLIMSMYTPDPAVIALGIQFLRIIGFSYILSGISTTFLYILRTVENVRFPLIINFTSFIINVVLNWILIFGKFGFPAMGIRGSATATLCARTVELAFALIYVFCFDRKLSFKVSDLFRTDRLLLKDFIHYSAPVVINETVWAIGSSFQSVIVGHISSDAVAANSIAGVVQRLATVAIMGTANFTAIAVGKQIGFGNAKKASDYASTMLKISVALGVCASVMILLLRRPFLSLYNVSDVTNHYAFEIMTVYALSTFFISFNYTNIIGVLRGGGDTKFAMTVDILTLWLIALPCGALAGLIFKWPMPVIFLFLTIDEPVKVLIGLSRFKSGKWLRNVTR